MSTAALNRQASRRAFLSRGARAVVALPLAHALTAPAGLPVPAFRVGGLLVRGLAVNAAGQFAVATDEQIAFHSPDGRLERTVPADAAVRALCFDARGRLFVAFQSQVARWDGSDRFERLGQPLDHPETTFAGLAVADDGSIFVADSGRRTVWRFDATGAVRGEIKLGERGFAVPGGIFPIAWHKNRLVVAEPARHRVHHYNAAGERLATWGAHSRGAEGFGGCCNPVAVAALADGSVVTVEAGQPRVKVFTAEGKFARQLAGPEVFAAIAPTNPTGPTEAAGCAQGLFDVAVSPHGRVLVLDRNSGEVRVLA